MTAKKDILRQMEVFMRGTLYSFDTEEERTAWINYIMMKLEDRLPLMEQQFANYLKRMKNGQDNVRRMLIQLIDKYDQEKT